MQKYKLTDFLPTTKKEVDLRGWDYLDIILFSADAYVDHPSFGAAVIGRTLESQGYRVAIVPQPDWHGDYRDFKKLGKPRLFFGIAPGCMDSMVNKYTAARRLRSEDAYSPDGRHDLRPEYPTIVYTKILKELYPDVPVVLGGIEASMRRITHYDYWQDKLLPSILSLSGADMITYGMGEKVTVELAALLNSGTRINDITDLPQTVYITNCNNVINSCRQTITLHSHEQCLANKKAQAENIRHIEEESNKIHASRLVQQIGRRWVVVNPPYPPMTTEELDATYELPFMRVPHPKYKDKRIPAYDMIKFSINIHRGCFGGCSFCTISAHQGKFITCRSKESILREVKEVIKMDDFKGYLSDLGGPSANMYGMGGRNPKACEKCSRPSCINPNICPNLNTDHSSLTEIYREVDKLPGIKKSFIGSGVRYDLILHRSKDEKINAAAREYTEELITRHVSGRLKVAPEHTEDNVLRMMRKPPFSQFEEFKRIFDSINRKHGLRQQIIPYFMSSHPCCKAEDMAELAAKTKRLDFQLEQVQDFTPTPMTISTEAWYTGYAPYTLEPVFSAKTPSEKQSQRHFFFWYKPEEQRDIERDLRQMGRSDLLPVLCPRGGSMKRDYGKKSKNNFNGSQCYDRNNANLESISSDKHSNTSRKQHVYNKARSVSKQNNGKGVKRSSYNPNFDSQGKKRR